MIERLHGRNPFRIRQEWPDFFYKSVGQKKIRSADDLQVKTLQNAAAGISCVSIGCQQMQDQLFCVLILSMAVQPLSGVQGLFDHFPAAVEMLDAGKGGAVPAGASRQRGDLKDS